MSTVSKVDLTGGKTPAAPADQATTAPVVAPVVTEEAQAAKPPKKPSGKTQPAEGDGELTDLDSSDVEVPNYSVTVEGLTTVGVMAGNDEEAVQKAFAKLGIVKTSKQVTVGPISD